MKENSVTVSIQEELDDSPSYFRAHLLREDLDRLSRIDELCHQMDDRETFLREANFVGWTPGDFRTHELKDWLDPFLEAWFAAKDAGKAQDPDRLLALWQAFDINRLEILAGCLSTSPRAGLSRP